MLMDNQASPEQISACPSAMGQISVMKPFTNIFGRIKRMVVSSIPIFFIRLKNITSDLEKIVQFFLFKDCSDKINGISIMVLPNPAHPLYM
jgi:hypothetical protein